MFRGNNILKGSEKIWLIWRILLSLMWLDERMYKFGEKWWEIKL